MEVKVVLEEHNVDGYYTPDVFSINTDDEAIAESYVGDYVDSVEEFWDRYEISTHTVTKLKPL